MLKEISNCEIDFVNGAGDVGDAAADGAALGSIAGAVITNTLSGAIRGGALGGLLFGVGSLSYNLATAAGAGTVGSRLGSWIYDQVNDN